MGLVVQHEHILVADVLEHQQHVAQSRLDLIGSEALAERRAPQQHITVVGQQLGAFAFGRCDFVAAC